MIGRSKFEFCCKVCLVASLLYFEDILGLEWKNKYIQSYFKLTSLPSSMAIDEALVSEVTHADSVSSCARFCGNNERPSFYYNKNEEVCYCNNGIDTRLTPGDPTDDGSSDIIYGSLISSVRVSTNSSTLKYDVQPHKENCFVLYHHGYRTNAVYTVKPIGGTVQDTYCDMDNVLDVGAEDCLQWLQVGHEDDGVYNIRLSNGTTARAWCDQTGGGWTVFQHRYDGSVDFYRTWAEYVNGFGDPAGEYWLGLEAMYLLTQHQSSLRIDVEAFDDQSKQSAFAEYDSFSLNSATDKYRLSVGTYNGDCGDSLSSSVNQLDDQQQFTTRDSDNDNYHRNCANYKKGAWWYNSCSLCNLNALYRSGQYTGGYTGMHWQTCWGHSYSVKTSKMAIKRN